MKIIRFFETPDHGSRFEQLEVPFPQAYTDEFANVYHLSRHFEGDSVLAYLPADLDQDWHVAPHRQLVVVLVGRLEVETTDGEIRQFSAGSMCMADDTSGKGHRTRVIEGPATLLFMRVPDQFDVTEWTRG